MHSEEPASLKCQECPKAFLNKKKLKDHQKESYNLTCNVRFINPQQIREKRQLFRVGGVFACPFCPKALTSTKGVKKHACFSRGMIDDDGELGSQGKPEAVFGKLPMPEMSTSQTSNIPRKRGFEAMVLRALSQIGGSERERKRALFAVDDLQLPPITLKNHELGKEWVVLGHRSVRNDLPTDRPLATLIDPTMLPNNPTKTLCSNCSPTPPVGLEGLFKTSPYSALLQKLNFIELTTSICELLNDDWVRHPELRFASCKVFAG
ncbi:hypothetical protein BX616_007465, partial [Lobosporangium transversale]